MRKVIEVNEGLENLVIRNAKEILECLDSTREMLNVLLNKNNASKISKNGVYVLGI